MHNSGDTDLRYAVATPVTSHWNVSGQTEAPDRVATERAIPLAVVVQVDVPLAYSSSRASEDADSDDATADPVSSHSHITVEAEEPWELIGELERVVTIRVERPGRKRGSRRRSSSYLIR